VLLCWLQLRAQALQERRPRTAMQMKAQTLWMMERLAPVPFATRCIYRIPPGQMSWVRGRSCWCSNCLCGADRCFGAGAGALHRAVCNHKVVTDMAFVLQPRAHSTGQCMCACTPCCCTQRSALPACCASLHQTVTGAHHYLCSQHPCISSSTCVHPPFPACRCCTKRDLPCHPLWPGIPCSLSCRVVGILAEQQTSVRYHIRLLPILPRAHWCVSQTCKLMQQLLTSYGSLFVARADLFQLTLA
jgi:hypothetical protein